MLNESYLMYLLDVVVKLAVNVSYKYGHKQIVFKIAKLLMTFVED